MAPGLQGKVCIIDPVSPEFNRGSFCYLPYILFSALKSRGYEVELRENFCAADIDDLKYADHYLIALWSHPQIEHVKTLVRFLPPGVAQVFGYNPLIEKEGLPHYTLSTEEIYAGINSYSRYFDSFQQILLSDCDMHLRKYSGQVYPLFTSYGCPRGCSFCPSTTNQPKRIILGKAEVEENLWWMASEGKTNIHFTDEDFFFDAVRAKKIVDYIIKLDANFKLIALAERHTLSRFLKAYGSKPLQKAGFKLLEVGLESASEDLGREMGKGGLEACKRLFSTCSVPILWLTLTFFPGETIKTLRDTGLFLKKYGLEPEDLYSRITTNGTYGGLGQFFQPYEGTPQFKDLPDLGRTLTTRPLRLLPSFIPNSFLEDTVTKLRKVEKEEEYWYDLYRVTPPHEKLPLGKIKEMASCWKNKINGYISLAVSARIGVIV